MFQKVVAFFVVCVISTVLVQCKQNSFDDFTNYETANPERFLKTRAPVGVNSEGNNRRRYLKQDDVISKNVDHNAFPKYKFTYGVDDKYTGDKKFQYEERDGNIVKGQYKVIDPDGYIRIVDYTVDKDRGYNAVVTRKEYPSFSHNLDKIHNFFNPN